MKDKKRFALLAICVLSVTMALGGCKSGTTKITETETQTESQAATQATEKETEAVKNTYTSSKGTFSIDLPDATWTATKEDEKNKWVFTSAELGKITVTHKGSAIKASKLPEDQSEAEDLLAKEKENSFSNVEYKKESISSANLYYYSGKTADAAELGYTYLIRYLVSAKEEGYTITAELKTDDSVSFQQVKSAVTSFQMLKADTTPETEAAKQDNTDENNSDASNSEGTSSESSSSTADSPTGYTNADGESYRYFFDANGNTVYAYPTEDGNWVDANGTQFYFDENGVSDSNGVSYSYDGSDPNGGSSSSASEDTATDSSNSEAATSDGNTADFYDSNGNYITATQDANGNWIGSDGKSYTFSDKGVTDSDGNFTAW